MRNGMIRILILAAMALATLISARVASAQCSSIGLMARDVGMAPANPFQAVRTTTRTPPPGPRIPASLMMKPEIVSRDSQGRVRFDRAAGEVHMETGPDAGADLQVRFVTICDPVRGAIVQLDNANRAATIHHLVSLPESGSSASPTAFCRVPGSPKNSPNLKFEDLGHRSIEGFDAVGWRSITTIPVPNSSPAASMQRIREEWCSEELRAVLLEMVSGSLDGPKEEIGLTKIERTEPDPALFQIPSDYTVSEALQQPRFSGSVVLGSQPTQRAMSQPPLVTH
jgi:hypothetical protein